MPPFLQIGFLVAVRPALGVRRWLPCVIFLASPNARLSCSGSSSLHFQQAGPPGDASSRSRAQMMGIFDRALNHNHNARCCRYVATPLSDAQSAWGSLHRLPNLLLRPRAVSLDSGGSCLDAALRGIVPTLTSLSQHPSPICWSGPRVPPLLGRRSCLLSPQPEVHTINFERLRKLFSVRPHRRASSSTRA